MAASPLNSRRFLQLSGLPVLLYHDVVVGAPANKYAVSVEHFREQLRFIRENGYRVLSLADLCDKRVSYDRAVVITFDDGLVSAFDQACPLLASAGVGAEFFVNTASVGKPGFLSWDQLRQMRDLGMSLQSHGHHHVVCSLLSRTAALQQLKYSRELLEEKLAGRISAFAVPYGLINRRVIRSAYEAGFRIVCTSTPLPARIGHSVVSRIAIYANTSMREFSGILERRLLDVAARCLRSAAFFLPKKIILRVNPRSLGVLAPQI